MKDKHITITTGDSEDGTPMATILWKINLDSVLATSRFPPEIEVHGIPWHLIIKKKKEYFAAYLNGLVNDSIMWSVDVNARFTLINKDTNNNFTNEFANTYNHSSYSFGWYHFFKWDQLIDEEKGFVNDNEIKLEVHFTLRNIMGIRKNARFCFTDAGDPRHDVTLVIGEKKLYVSKQILAVHSPVFNTMFYGNFDEKDKKEIELKDVEYEDFLEMLNAIYPTGKKITDDNAERLLAVADRFEIKAIIDQVEKFIIDSSEFSEEEKLKISDEYRLIELQGKCLDSLDTISDVTDLYETDEYNLLSDTTKLALLEKIMKLANSAKDD